MANEAEQLLHDVRTFVAPLVDKPAPVLLEQSYEAHTRYMQARELLQRLDLLLGTQD